MNYQVIYLNSKSPEFGTGVFEGCKENIHIYGPLSFEGKFNGKEVILASYRAGRYSYAYFNSSNGNMFVYGFGLTYDIKSSNDQPWREHHNNTLSLKFTYGMQSIGSHCFEGCTSLSSIELPNSIESIGSQAFFNCSSLTSITLPKSLTSIRSWMFADCSSLTNINIPNGITNIKEYAFEGCKSLEYVEWPGTIITTNKKIFKGKEIITYNVFW